MNYRIDIQILRGVSVLLVVLFHFGFSAAQSGFLGVDVFFVISGFLMAVLYKQSDILGFFTRRAKRLLPPYFVVIAATLCASFLFVTRNESAQVVTQAWFGTFYLSNIGFWMQNSYFSKAEFNPLLHLWSLGVEIQFYLCIPILVWFFNKWKLLLPLFLALSLALCLVMLGISGKTSFFMMPLRTWEFLLGFGTALYLCKNGNTLSDRRQLWGLL
ncbi:MAG: acyltransferase, partial [Pseudomonadota bacterium]